MIEASMHTKAHHVFTHYRRVQHEGFPRRVARESAHMLAGVYRAGR